MRRQYAGGAKPTTLTVNLGGSTADLAIAGTDFSNYPDGSVGPFFIVIDRGQVSEEKILCASRSGNVITVYNTGLTNGRGNDGTSVVAHSAGSLVEHVFTSVDADESNSHVNKTTGTVHGLVLDDVVTTNGTQTLTNKTISQSQVTDLTTNLAAKFPLNVATSAQTVSYTLDIEDAQLVVEMNVATANTLTIPPNSSVAFPVGTSIFVVQTGAGQTTITAGAGVTVNSFIGLKIIGRWAGCTLIKRATDTWVAVGGLVA
jgi:hypothetical protein